MANFTTTMVSFNEAAGANIALDKPSVTLLITPNEGYTVDSDNFSAITPLSSRLSNVTFSQSGNNVRAVATFNNPSIMPGYDIDVPICIRGFAEQAMYSIAGTITNTLCNTSSPVVNSFGGSGAFGSSEIIVEIPVTASSGYYFPTQPTLVLSSGNANNYNISYSNNLDDKGNITGVDFTVNYTFPNSSIIGDTLSLNACAQQIYNPAVKITGYATPTNTILSTGENRSLTIYGVQGAAYSLTYKNSSDVTINTFTGVVGSNGTVTLNIVYPATTNANAYTFTLTGDLASSFNTPSGQPSVWTISQESSVTTTTTTVAPGPVAQTMILFGADSSNAACGNIIAGVEFALRTTRYSANSFINPGDTVYTDAGLTTPFTFALPLYYGYFVDNSVIAAWVYLNTEGVVISSGYCS